MKKILFSILTFSFAAISALATNPVTTAMPSLSIAPDGRAAGMGDAGVATNPDLNSQHWNPAKYAFMESKGGLTANYTPWLTKLVNDIDLAYSMRVLISLVSRISFFDNASISSC